MIIRSELLTEGLFGEALLWMLEIVPFIQSQGWMPDWQIRSRNYGQPPNFDIFPSIVDVAYTPEPTGPVVSFEHLQRTKKHHFRGDFEHAHACWVSMFRLTDAVLRRVDEFCDAHFTGKTVLGIHYRGT